MEVKKSTVEKKQFDVGKKKSSTLTQKGGKSLATYYEAIFSSLFLLSPPLACLKICETSEVEKFHRMNFDPFEHDTNFSTIEHDF